jgi:hypothetical protein
VRDQVPQGNVSEDCTLLGVVYFLVDRLAGRWQGLMQGPHLPVRILINCAVVYYSVVFQNFRVELIPGAVGRLVLKCVDCDL